MKLLVKHKVSWLLLGLLPADFILRLLVYYQTELFRFGDWTAYLEAVEKIANGENVSLWAGYFSFTNSYLGYFAKYKLGNLDYWFIVNSGLAVLSLLLVYRIVMNLTGSRKYALAGLILGMLYNEYNVISCVFYPIVIEICLTCLIILLLIRIGNENNIYKDFARIAMVSILVHVSLMFRSTMSYFWILLFLSGIIIYIRFKNTYLPAMYLLGGILILSGFFILPRVLSVLEPVYNRDDRSIQFVFLGHTLYGGSGGEGSFIYEENELLYQKRYSQYLSEKGIQEDSWQDKENFRKEEIKKFILEHPAQWIKLQARKFFYTFGIIPEGNSFRILITGKWGMPWKIIALLLSGPVMLIVLLCVAGFDGSLFKKFFLSPHSLIVFMLFLYLITASVFYGHYSERYRILPMVIYIIPVTGVFLAELPSVIHKKSVRMRSIKAIIIGVFIIAWSFQLYEVGVEQKSRYFKAIEIQDKE